MTNESSFFDIKTHPQGGAQYLAYRASSINLIYFNQKERP